MKFLNKLQRDESEKVATVYRQNAFEKFKDEIVMHQGFLNSKEHDEVYYFRKETRL